MGYTPKLKTFNPAKVIVTYGGVILSGFSDQIVVVQRQTPTWESDPGVDGEVVRWNQNDRRGKIVMRMQPTSTDNAILAGFQIADENGIGEPLPFKMKDELIGDVCNAPFAWIVAPPVMTKRKGIEAYEWILDSNNVIMVPTGVA